MLTARRAPASPPQVSGKPNQLPIVRCSSEPSWEKQCLKREKNQEKNVYTFNFNNTKSCFWKVIDNKWPPRPRCIDTYCTCSKSFLVYWKSKPLLYSCIFVNLFSDQGPTVRLHNMTRSGSAGIHRTPAEEIKCHILSSHFVAQNTRELLFFFSKWYLSFTYLKCNPGSPPTHPPLWWEIFYQWESAKKHPHTVTVSDAYFPHKICNTLIFFFAAMPSKVSLRLAQLHFPLSPERTKDATNIHYFPSGGTSVCKRCTRAVALCGDHTKWNGNDEAKVNKRLFYKKKKEQL